MDTLDDLAELVELVADRRQLYLRYSLGPERDIAAASRDYEADVALPGLPCTPLWPEDWWPRPAVDWIARRVCKYLELARVDERRRAWVLAGRVAGYGPDHEPLLVAIEPLAWLSDRLIGQARECYHRCFQVGRTSV
jgi:hypothetical protein